MCKRNKKGRKTDKESFPLFQKKKERKYDVIIVNSHPNQISGVR